MDIDDAKPNVKLRRDLIDLTHEIINDYRHDLESGSISPGGPLADELADVQEILDALDVARTRNG